MQRHPVRIAPGTQPEGELPTAGASPVLLSRLGLRTDEFAPLRFGLVEAEALWEADDRLGPGELRLSADLAGYLRLRQPLSVTILRSSPSEIALGPLVGLLISAEKLEAVLGGKQDHVYCRYALAGRETGGLLLFFAPEGLDPAKRRVNGYQHICEGAGRCRWEPVEAPLPRVIYDRCFGGAGRAAAAALRAAVSDLGVVVLNHPVKITKLRAFGALQPFGELAPHLPLTLPLTEESLLMLMGRYDDLYIKPDSLYKGQGVCRLRRHSGGWELLRRVASANERRWVPRADQVIPALAELLDPDLHYLVQEGLPLARYLGNRFDLRSLVQCNGRGDWQVTGVVARIAPQGSTITSPRSGGQVAPLESALRHAFGQRAEEVRAEVERVSLALAERVDQQLGPCAELGLDLGVLEDGSVKLIEVNGIPLRVSLERLKDPRIGEQIDRFPIHYAAYLDTGSLPLSAEGEAAAPGPPLIGIMLGPREMGRLRQRIRYRQMAAQARAAGASPVFFDLAGLDGEAGAVRGWVEQKGGWQQVTLPLPEVIYNRATYGDAKRRRAAIRLLRTLTARRRTRLINPVNAFSKLDVYKALRFFPQTAPLAPETAPLSGPELLTAMLSQFPALFLKGNHGSHGSDVCRIRADGGTVALHGRIAGHRVEECFDRPEQLLEFLALLRPGCQWVVQQGIELPSVDGRVFDLRVVAQKDGEGRWQLPLVLIRLAGRGEVAANMSLGGEPFLPGPFRERFGHQLPFLSELEERVSDAALRTLAALESRFGLLGEVGIDIGLDREGSAWVFEANTKPLHPAVPGMEEDRLIRLPFAYGVHLAHQARAGRCTGLTPCPGAQGR
ncbi:MAG: YheC/YheD family protein [Bacillota bacterium]